MTAIGQAPADLRPGERYVAADDWFVTDAPPAEEQRQQVSRGAKSWIPFLGLATVGLGVVTALAIRHSLEGLRLYGTASKMWMAPAALTAGSGALLGVQIDRAIAPEVDMSPRRRPGPHRQAADELYERLRQTGNEPERHIDGEWRRGLNIGPVSSPGMDGRVAGFGGIERFTMDPDHPDGRVSDRFSPGVDYSAVLERADTNADQLVTRDELTHVAIADGIVDAEEFDAPPYSKPFANWWVDVHMENSVS